MLADDFNASEPAPDTSERAVEVRHSIVMALLRASSMGADELVLYADVLCAFVLRGEMAAGETYQSIASGAPVRYADDLKSDQQIGLLAERVTQAACHKCGHLVAHNAAMVKRDGLHICLQCARAPLVADMSRLSEAERKSFVDALGKPAS